MRKLTATFCLTIAVLVGSAGVSFGADYREGVTTYQRGDYTTAFRELKLLAAEGNAEAQNNLGVMYRSGLGIPKDDQTALKWFRLAAEQGDAPAQANLGYMYANGMGIPQDWVYAYMWSKISASSLFMGAVNNIDIFAKQMTLSQLEKAQKLARECVRKEYIGC